MKSDKNTSCLDPIVASAAWLAAAEPLTSGDPGPLELSVISIKDDATRNLPPGVNILLGSRANHESRIEIVADAYGNLPGRFPRFSSTNLQANQVPIAFLPKMHNEQEGIRAFEIFSHNNPRDRQGNFARHRYGVNSVDRIVRGKFVVEF